MRRSRNLALICTIALAFLPRAAIADEPATAPAAMFPKGSFTLTSDVAYTHTFDDESNIGALQLGVNYFVFDNFSLGAEITGYGIFMDDDGDNTTAAAI